VPNYVLLSRYRSQSSLPDAKGQQKSVDFPA
jgi:hypothetical protein